LNRTRPGGLGRENVSEITSKDEVGVPYYLLEARNRMSLSARVLLGRTKTRDGRWGVEEAEGRLHLLWHA